MENNSIIKGTLNLDDLPFLKDYDQLKTRLSIRLNSPTRVKPDAVTMPFRDLSITFHIDVSDVVGKENASCTINTSLLDSIGAEKKRLYMPLMPYKTLSHFMSLSILKEEILST